MNNTIFYVIFYYDHLLTVYNLMDLRVIFILAVLIQLFLFAILLTFRYSKRKKLIEKKSDDTLFEMIIENANDLISIHDENGKFLFVTPSCKRVLGYDEEELIDRIAFEFHHPADRQRVREHRTKMLSSIAKSTPVIYRFRKKDNSYTYFETISKSFFTHDNKVRILAISRDISEKITYENERDKAASIFDHITQGILIYQLENHFDDSSLRLVSLNKASEKLLGLKKEEILNKKIDDAFPNLRDAGIPEMFADVVRNNELVNFDDYTYEDQKIKTNSFSFNAFPLPENHLAVAFSNITEIKQTALALRENEILFRNIFEQAASGIAKINPLGNVLMANQKFCEIIGYSPEELKKVNYLEFTYDDDKEIDFFVMTEINQHKHDRISSEKRLKTKRGQIIWVSTHISAVYNEDGDLSYSIIIINDITKTKLLQKNLQNSEKLLKDQNEELQSINKQINQINSELSVAKIKAEESDKLKTAFLANMSHEIRTPMNAILGFADLLRSENLSEEKQNYFTNIIFEKGNYLMQIINDLIDISKIESNQVIVNESEIDLKRLFEDLLVVFEEYLGNIGKTELTVTYKMEIKDLESFFVLSDQVKLNQILSNLISNAIKYSERGKIIFGCSEKSSDQFMFYVIDEGIGIKEDFLPKIFERFRQADESMTKRYGGTGLGLAISKALVEMLGGNIWVESEYQKGSKFFFTIPVKKTTRVQKTTKLSAIDEITDKYYEKDWDHKSILVVEDDLYSYQYIEALLKGTKVTTYHAQDGNDAYEKLLQNKYDLILMDIQLPGLNGLEITKKIRDKGLKTPVIAQTAYARHEDRELALNAGCDEYITKPVDSRRIFNILEKYL